MPVIPDSGPGLFAGLTSGFHPPGRRRPMTSSDPQSTRVLIEFRSRHRFAYRGIWQLNITILLEVHSRGRFAYGRIWGLNTTVVRELRSRCADSMNGPVWVYGLGCRWLIRFRWCPDLMRGPVCVSGLDCRWPARYCPRLRNLPNCCCVSLWFPRLFSFSCFRVRRPKLIVCFCIVNRRSKGNWIEAGYREIAGQSRRDYNCYVTEGRKASSTETLPGEF